MFTIRKYLDFFLLLLASLLSAASGDKIITSGSGSGSGSVTVEMSALSGWQARKTWHFASVLTPTHEINEDFFQLAFHTDRQNINMERASINVVGLTALPFEGYIQSRGSLELPRLHRWMPDAIWQNVSGKLHRSTAYQQFSDAAANDAFEYGNDGSLALSKGGRPRKAISVSTYQTMRTMIFYNLNPN